MPSPFPGMDPYLEGELWTSFHALFVPEIIRLLMPQLRPRYIALAQKYQIAVDSSDAKKAAAETYPDVRLVHTGTPSAPALTSAFGTAPLEMATVIAHSEPHLWIEIRDIKNRKLVTAIEFLSPGNKIGRGRRKYLRKRQRLLDSTAHLLEIDLLRHGQRVPMARRLPSVPYFVFLSRVEKRPITQIWPIRLDEPLPDVPVPLLAGDPDAVLTLQKALSAAFELSDFDALVDYQQPPDAPFSADDAAWVDSYLREKSIRT